MVEDMVAGGSTVRHAILETADGIVHHDRQGDYGSPEDSFGNIAGLWSVYLGRTIEPWDVALMMDLLKTARLMASPAHVDSWVDKAGYSACGAEAALGVSKMGVSSGMGDA